MSSNYELIILVLLGLIFVKLFFPQLISKYNVKGAPLNISGTGMEPGAFFGLPDKLECVPGPSKDAAYFNRTDNPGGICGDQQFVNDQMRKFKINE